MSADARCLACSCNGTVPLPEALGGVATVKVHALCRADVAAFRAASTETGTLVVGCTQEQPFFSELAARLEAGADLRFVNVRELAVWSSEG